jgi:hypothetical protein
MEFKAEQTTIKRKALEKGKRPSCPGEAGGSANTASAACVHVFGAMVQSTISKLIDRYSLMLAAANILRAETEAGRAGEL